MSNPTDDQMNDAYEWLDTWISENINSPGYFEEKSHFARDAEMCRQEAVRDGIDPPALIEAAGGDLEKRLLNAQNSLTDRHVRDQAAKDD